MALQQAVLVSAEQSPFLLTMFVALALISWFCQPRQADIVYDLAQQSGAVYLPGQSVSLFNFKSY